MKRKVGALHGIRSVGIIFLFVLIQLPSFAEAQKLSDYRWENRILILVDPEVNSAAMQKQLLRFQEQPDQLIERDLIIFKVHGETIRNENGELVEITIEELKMAANITTGFKGVILLGKDGGVKQKQDFEVDPMTIFDLIDSMPMRKSELKNKG